MGEVAAIADRIRNLIRSHPSFSEETPVEGAWVAATSAWSVNEHMAVMAREDGGLMVLVAKVDHAGFGAESGAHPIPMSARGFGGWIHVDAHGLASDGALAKWVQRGIDFAQTLPRIDDF